MLKIALVACAALCTSAGATVMLTQPHPSATVTSAPSFQDLHASAHLEFLPVRIEPDAP